MSKEGLHDDDNENRGLYTGSLAGPLLPGGDDGQPCLGWKRFLLSQDGVLPPQTAAHQVQMCLPETDLLLLRHGKLRLLSDVLACVAVPAELLALSGAPDNYDGTVLH